MSGIMIACIIAAALVIALIGGTAWLAFCFAGEVDA